MAKKLNDLWWISVETVTKWDNWEINYVIPPSMALNYEPSYDIGLYS